eukprot:CAMPEP_0177761884 /NCGR_PEP_ID=MMETSP0491_2-20121128/6045_1 /TAXON_ID=63592 /ORGANISM="Tetraselmis chuii, Strain PLY429" /LENGTH=276 /DNA_ID=CAMNT_0019277893 /DNA_START=1 /DNA_END=831 /DNA_ORIENTATION=+
MQDVTCGGRAVDEHSIRRRSVLFPKTIRRARTSPHSADPSHLAIHKADSTLECFLSMRPWESSAFVWFGAGLASGCCFAYLLRRSSSSGASSSSASTHSSTINHSPLPGGEGSKEKAPPNNSTAKRHTTVDGSPMRAYALRVPPGEELKAALQAFVTDRDLQAVAVVTCVGSLTSATLRLANADRDSGDNDVVTRSERFEILSLVGTLSATHGCHLHVSLGDRDGRVFGGHCVGGMNVFTTAEVVLAECRGMAFERHYDERTGFKELCVLCGPVES